MPKCEKCGKVNVATAEFCIWCGVSADPSPDSDTIPKRDLGDLIGHTFTLYGRNFWQFILIGLPSQILGLITLLAFPDTVSLGFGSEAELEAAAEEIAEFAKVAFPISILSGLMVLVVQGATIHAVGKQYLGQNIDVMESLKRGLSKLFILIIVGILVVLALSLTAPLMLILIGIPLAFFLAISWAFVFQVVVIEGEGPFAALGGSYNLVKGSRWRVLGIGIVYLLIQVGLQIFITVITSAIGGIVQPLATLVSSIAYALLAPVMFISLTVLYFDLRARKEGLTLDSLSLEMGDSVAGVKNPEDLRDM